MVFFINSTSYQMFKSYSRLCSTSRYAKLFQKGKSTCKHKNTNSKKEISLWSFPVNIVRPVSIHQVKKRKTPVHKIYIPLTVQHGFCLFNFFSLNNQVHYLQYYSNNWNLFVSLYTWYRCLWQRIIWKKERIFTWMTTNKEHKHFHLFKTKGNEKQSFYCKISTWTDNVVS